MQKERKHKGRREEEKKKKKAKKKGIEDLQKAKGESSIEVSPLYRQADARWLLLINIQP